MKNPNSVQVLVFHLVVALLLAYLSYMIISKKQMPNAMGVLLGFLAVAVVVAHIYYYIKNKGGDKVHNFDPNNPNYERIGGAVKPFM